MEKKKFFQGLLVSPTLAKKRASHKIAYVGCMTALAVVVNALEIKLSVVQFSFTMFFSVFAGIFLGGLSGFGACFLGDAIGFMLHPMGEYSPFIGISTGLMAFFAALCVYTARREEEEKWGIYLRLSLACVLIFYICTAGITTLYLNLVWVKGMPYWEYLWTRLFVQGQIYNSLVNSALVIGVIPLLAKYKALHILK